MVYAGTAPVVYLALPYTWYYYKSNPLCYGGTALNGRSPGRIYDIFLSTGLSRGGITIQWKVCQGKEVLGGEPSRRESGKFCWFRVIEEALLRHLRIFDSCRTGTYVRTRTIRCRRAKRENI